MKLETANEETIHPFVVMSYDGFYNTKPLIVERYAYKIEAMRIAQLRQDAGYVVSVFKELAYSINDEP